MPRVTTVTARKDYPEFGIKKGQLHYTWQLYVGPQQRSLTPPRQSQLTGSEKKAAAYRAVENLEDAIAAATTPEAIKDALETAATDAQDAIDAYDDSISSMEDAFPGGSPSIDEANEQRDSVESFQSECESAASDVESLDYNDYQVKDGVQADKPGGITWDDLTEEGQAEMLEAARDLASGPSIDF